MEIDLRKVKTVCISLKTSTKRRENISRVMEKLCFENWSFFDGVECGDTVRGCALSHAKVLQSCDGEKPILVLEDDADFTGSFAPVIEVSSDVDAVYLGYSWWAWAMDRANQSCMKHPTSVQKVGNWYKIHGMTSAHAILYLGESYSKRIQESILSYLTDPNGNGHCDVAMAKTQIEYNVIAPPKPFFIQVCERNTFWTQKPLEEYR